MEKRVLIIIPAYNEEKNIAELLQKLKQYDGYDVLVVNDCSTDHTIQVLQEVGVKYIDLPINLGIGGAVQTGYVFALRNNYDIAVQVDGDGQHNPEYIDNMIKAIDSGADMVIGSRFMEREGFQSSAARRVGITFLSFLIKLITGLRIKDPTSGFRACNRNIIKLFAESYPIDYPEPETIIQAVKCNYSVIEIPVIMNERKAGKSSINFIKSIYYMIKVSIAILICSRTLKVKNHKKQQWKENSDEHSFKG